MIYEDKGGQHPVIHIVVAPGGENVPWDKPLPDAEKTDIYFLSGPIAAAILEGGMTSGKPSVGLRIDLPDGRVVIQQTSVAALEGLLGACRGVAQRKEGAH